MLTGGHKQKANFDEPIGILMLDTNFERTEGDVANKATFPFPVIVRRVENASAFNVIENQGKGLINNFIKEAQYLIKHHHVKGITTTCGFMALHQKAMSNAIKSVPVFASSMCQLNALLAMTGDDEKIAVLTYNKHHLTRNHFYSVGVAASDLDRKITIYGMDDTKHKELFTVIKEDDARIYDKRKATADLVELAMRAKADAGDKLRFILLECTNMPPYAHAIQAAVGVPVFDVTTLIKWMHTALHRKPFAKL